MRDYYTTRQCTTMGFTRILISVFILSAYLNSKCESVNIVDKTIEDRRMVHYSKLSTLFLTDYNKYFHTSAIYPLVLLTNFSVDIFPYADKCNFFFQNESQINPRYAENLLIDISKFCFSSWFLNENEIVYDGRKMNNTTPSDPRIYYYSKLLIICKFLEETKDHKILAEFVYPTTYSYPTIIFNTKYNFFLTDKTIDLITNGRSTKLMNPVGKITSLNNNVELVETLCHEIGHFLGFEHIDDVGSVMYPYHRNLYFQQSDYDLIRELKNFFPQHFNRRMIQVIDLLKQIKNPLIHV